MAETIGVARRWIQHAGTPREHFDVSLGRRQRAITLGARVIARRELALLLRARREEATDRRRKDIYR